MPTLNLTDRQVELLRYTLTKSDDWSISPVEYHPELFEVLDALTDNLERSCATCGKPRREHRFGYSADRCLFQ